MRRLLAGFFSPAKATRKMGAVLCPADRLRASMGIGTIGVIGPRERQKPNRCPLYLLCELCLLDEDAVMAE
jgi:hypothetical protein